MNQSVRINRIIDGIKIISDLKHDVFLDVSIKVEAMECDLMTAVDVDVIKAPLTLEICWTCGFAPVSMEKSSREIKIYCLFSCWNLHVMANYRQ